MGSQIENLKDLGIRGFRGILAILYEPSLVVS